MNVKQSISSGTKMFNLISADDGGTVCKINQGKKGLAKIKATFNIQSFR